MQAWYDADARQARPVHPRARGLGPERGDQRRRPLGGVRRRPRDRPADPDQHVDRPAGPEGGGRAGARDLRRLRRDPGDAQQPDRRDGPARLPRPDWVSRLGHPDRQPPRLPGRSPTTSPRRCCTSCSSSPAWRRRSTSTSRAARGWLFERTVHEGCDRAGIAEQGKFADAFAGDGCLVKLGCKGPVVKCNVPVRGWVNGIGGCPNVGGICIGLHERRASPTASCRSWSRRGSACWPPHGARFTYGPVLKHFRRRADEAHLRGRARVAATVGRAADRLCEPLVRTACPCA